MLGLIIENWDNILVVVIFILFILYLINKGAERKVSKILLYLVCEAERIYGSGTGELKYSAVATWIYDRFPSILKVLFTNSQVDRLIEQAVEEMKIYLQNNKDAQECLARSGGIEE